MSHFILFYFIFITILLCFTFGLHIKYMSMYIYRSHTRMGIWFLVFGYFAFIGIYVYRLNIQGIHTKYRGEDLTGMLWVRWIFRCVFCVYMHLYKYIYTGS